MDHSSCMNNHIRRPTSSAARRVSLPGGLGRPRVAIHLHGRLGPLAREDAAAAGRLLAPAARLAVVRVELRREEVGAGAASPAVAEPRVRAARQQKVGHVRLELGQHLRVGGGEAVCADTAAGGVSSRHATPLPVEGSSPAGRGYTPSPSSARHCSRHTGRASPVHTSACAREARGRCRRCCRPRRPSTASERTQRAVSFTFMV